MNFFQVDLALENTIYDGRQPVRIRIELLDNNNTANIIEHNSIEGLNLISNQDKSGLITTTAELSLTLDDSEISNNEISTVRIYLSCGENSSFLHRVRRQMIRTTPIKLLSYRSNFINHELFYPA